MRFLYDQPTSDLYDHSILRAAVAPFLRLYYSSPGEKAMGMIGGVWAWVTADGFAFLVLLLVASGTADTIYGRTMAHRLNQYDQAKADIGLHSKIMGVVLALLIWGFELWWANALVDGPLNGLHTAGFLSAAVALTLFVNDLKSIQEKRMRFGQPPLPVLSQVLAFLDRLASIMGAPKENAPLVERRRGDQADTGARRRADDDKEEHRVT